jgi:hypothetical protein
MTTDELRAWHECPPTKTPQALAVAEAVGDLFGLFDRAKAALKRHANEFVPLAQANADLVIYKRHNAELQAELARLRKLLLPAAEWELTEPEYVI